MKIFKKYLIENKYHNTILYSVFYPKLGLFFILLFILLLFSCKKDKETNVTLQNQNKISSLELKTTTKVGVVNVDRLRLRQDNDLHSKTLRYLDKGEIVKIIGKNNERIKIDEMEDYWYEVEYNGVKGWLYGYFIDIYSDYENAYEGAKKYLNTKIEISEISLEIISNNLFFISRGKIFQVLNSKNGIAKVLKTEENWIVTNYFFTRKQNFLYYIAKPNNSEINGNLYFYNLIDDTSTLIIKNVYYAIFNTDNNNILLLSIDKKSNVEQWVLSLFGLDSLKITKEIVKIEKNKQLEDLAKDYFSLTLKRECGTLVSLEWDTKRNFIYFKPPEENQTYLISISDGNLIKIDVQKSNQFNIDSRYLTINSLQDAAGETLYSLILKDKISGFEKEIIRSKLYPINFSLSPKQNFVAISLISINDVKEDYFSSSVYVLSLSNYSLIPISTDGYSYQPKWSY
ncbi:MAG: hypothetical protein A2086_05725 [Spirochaetes bacterium GWD1_27_9]|nr:MAG: hypothetical protein A2Z98_15590 [Spirochaetes bacterium GWB1_27_13]OHD35276.1 MAG: hypothetical protein A2086_05725 [Spirochaetes bacterium GWD1_27_9]